MHLALAFLFASALPGAGPIDFQFVPVAPARPGPLILRSPGQRRAVVLLQGLRLHPFSQANAYRASFFSWQKPGSLLVRTLARDADVYAFAYSPNAPLDRIAAAPALGRAVAQLRVLGYPDIVLVGHSAGGLLARQFVEDHPGSGVTKVVQVCAPNTGSSWANLHPSALRGQEEFLQSLSRDGRRRMLWARAGRRIPPDVQFACLVGTGEVIGDGLVSCASQWPDDLQAQGIPAFPVFAIHLLVMRTEPGVGRVAALVRADLPRWDAARIAAARHRLRLPADSHAAGPGRRHG